MVLRDDCWQEQKDSRSYALPTDRLTAVIFDLVFFTPIATLLIAPIQRQMFIHKVLSEDTYLPVLILTCLTVVAGAGLLYQSLFWFYWGCTPGQRLMGLRVEFEGEKSYSRALLRSLVWWLELLLVGLPFASVYCQRERRPIHDRVAETGVVSKWRTIGSPSMAEQLVFSNSQKTGVALAGLALSGVVAGFMSLPTQRAIAVISEECSEVTRAMSEIGNFETTTDLQTAMALYGADGLSIECLSWVAQKSLWSRTTEDKSLSYLAMAFAKMEDAELSDRYYKEVCREDEKSNSCTLSRMMDAFDKGPSAWREVWTKLDIRNRELNYFSKIWMIRFANRMGLFSSAEELLRKTEAIPSIGLFFTEQKIRSMSGQGKNREAEKFLSANEAHFSFKKKSELSAWLCNESIQSRCETGLACDRIQKNVERDPTLAQSDLVQMSLYRVAECQGGELPTGRGTPSARRFLNALASYRDENNIVPLQVMAIEPHARGIFAIEARRKLAEFSTSKDDIKALYGIWKNSRSLGRAENRFSRQLLGRLVEFGHESEARDVARRLVDSESDKKLIRIAGKIVESRTVEEMKKNVRRIEGRQPASTR